MKITENTLISGQDIQEVSKCLTSIMQGLPPDASRKLRTILKNYVGLFGIESAYKKMQGRTVAQIFEEYEPSDVSPIESGEIDGVQFELYGPDGADPSKDQSNDHTERP